MNTNIRIRISLYEYRISGTFASMCEHLPAYAVICEHMLAKYNRSEGVSNGREKNEEKAAEVIRLHIRDQRTSIIENLNSVQSAAETAKN